MSTLKMPKVDRQILKNKSAIISNISSFTKKENILSEIEELKPYETDGLAAYRQTPMLVVLPETTEEVSKILSYCNKNNIQTVGFSGLNNDNLTQKLATYSAFVPCKTYGLAECIHQFFLHLWLDKYMKIEEWNKSSSQNMDSRNFKI